MNRILVGIDFSDPSKTALSRAVELVAPRRGKILALHIVEQAMMNSIGEFSHLDSNEIISDLELRLSRFAAGIGAEDAVIETKLIVGHPAKDFARVADSFDPDLIILGAWGSGGNSVTRSGLTAKQIIQECRCDTLLSRSPNPDSEGIVACVDFSSYDKGVVKTASNLSRLEGASLQVLHVFYPPWKMDREASKSEEVADADFAQEYKAVIQGRIEQLLVDEGIKPGSADIKVMECLKHSEGILSYLEETEPEMVVIGARGSRRIESMILGRIAERIVIDSETSVYIVKNSL